MPRSQITVTEPTIFLYFNPMPLLYFQEFQINHHFFLIGVLKSWSPKKSEKIDPMAFILIIKFEITDIWMKVGWQVHIDDVLKAEGSFETDEL